jgi:hypothetical protein
MGLFDSYYDPQTYAAGSGGLVDRLLAQLNTQSQYQPVPGFQPAPQPGSGRNFNGGQFDPQTYAPNQAQPIAVGNNYQMPRIGGADQFTLNAQPTQGQSTDISAQSRSPQAEPDQPLPPAFGGTSYLERLNAGGGLIGSLLGDTTQQKNLTAQYHALIAAGVPQPKALLATINPEFAKTIVPEALSNKQKFVQLKDAMGAEKPAFVDETAQTVNGQPIADYNKQQAATTGGLGNLDLTGKDYLASIPVAQRGTVQGMVEGTIAPPSSFALSKPYWQNMIAAAKQVDPTFDSANWSGRVAGMKSFKSGADAGTVRSANQVLGHISDLTDKADELHNSDYPSWNYVKNKWNSQTGEDAANNWVTQAHAVADELSTFMKGAGHSSDTEIRQWQESLSPNMSPQQQRGAIKTLMGIYDHALQALEDKRTGAIGPMAAEKLGPLVTQAGQSAMGKVRTWGAGSAPGAAQGTGAPAPGAYVWSPDKGIIPK